MRRRQNILLLSTVQSRKRKMEKMKEKKRREKDWERGIPRHLYSWNFIEEEHKFAAFPVTLYPSPATWYITWMIRELVDLMFFVYIAKIFILFLFFCTSMYKVNLTKTGSRLSVLKRRHRRVTLNYRAGNVPKHNSLMKNKILKWEEYL